MKISYYGIKLLILQACICLLLACSPTPASREAVIEFNNTEHNFGKLSYRKEAEYNFQFSNSGKVPLVVSDVKTSCGCTVPEWPSKPVKPGSKGEIKIKYDSASPGVFNKEIKVHYNGLKSPVVLRIKGQVEYPDL